MNNNIPGDLIIMSGACGNMLPTFDGVVQRTLRNMEQKEGNYAEVTLKLKITLTRVKVFSEDRQTNCEILKPRFSYKVASLMNIKDEETGSAGGEYGFVWDESAGNYIAVPLEDGQMSFVDDMGERIVEVDDYDELPSAPVIHALPAPEEII